MSASQKLRDLKELLQEAGLMEEIGKRLFPWDKQGSKPIKVKISLESSYPRPQSGSLRPIHGFATAISH